MQDATIADLAQRYGVSVEAVTTLWRAITAGGGRSAQFNHPDLGGMGQWSGGMIMIGDMFNNGLKDRVARLCAELAEQPQPAEPTPSHQWWPAGLGSPSSTGSQNNMRYACFPESRRLVVERDGSLTVYDTGEHRLNGFSQAQSTSQTLTFNGADGAVNVDELKIVK